MIYEVVKLTSRRALPISQVCEKLSLSEKELKKTIKDATEKGYTCRIVDGYVTSKVPVATDGVDFTFGPVTPGKRVRVAIATDLHAGSTHFNSAGLLSFLNFAYDSGCRTVVCTGDILDGNAPVLIQDQYKTGWEGQVGELKKVLAQAPKMTWCAIDGNHDGYFSSSAGMVSGKLLEADLRRAGVDWTFLGTCLGRATLYGARWQLWHPHGGAGTRNAIRRILNDRIEDLDHHFDILAMGHFHKFASVHAYPENTFGVAGGTFQQKRSEFANRIARGWDVGGSIVSYSVDSEGRCREVSAEFIPTWGV